MSVLSDKQWKHVQMVGRLIRFAGDHGWQLAWADAYRDERVKYGSPNSLHRSRLAVDLVLRVDGVVQEGKTPESIANWKVLGDYWKMIGGTWGGDFTGASAGDYNHFSLEHNGYK